MKTIRQHIALFLALVAFLAPLSVLAQTRGIDVSKYQGDINWKKVADSKKVKFVYIKATEGMTIQDGYYRKNLEGARAVGLPVGSYHLYSSKTTAKQQFDNFSKVVKKSEQDLIPVLDIEAIHCNTLNIERVDQILAMMEKEYGVKPLIYTSEKVYFTHFDNKKYSSYQIFIANYRRFPKTRFTLWQFTQTGRVSGIVGDVDISEMSQSKRLDDIMIPKSE